MSSFTCGVGQHAHPRAAVRRTAAPARITTLSLALGALSPSSSSRRVSFRRAPRSRKVIMMAYSGDGAVDRDTEKPRAPDAAPGSGRGGGQGDFERETDNGGGLPPMPPKPPGSWGAGERKPYFPSRRETFLWLVGGSVLSYLINEGSLDKANQVYFDEANQAYVKTPEGNLLKVFRNEDGGICMVDRNGNLYCASGLDDAESMAGGVNIVTNDGTMINMWNDPKGRIYEKRLGNVDDLVTVQANGLDRDEQGNIMDDGEFLGEMTMFKDDVLDPNIRNIESLGDKPMKLREPAKPQPWFDPNKGKGFLGF